ncbi:MAG: hypothetical protein WC139_13800 [Candidatus Kapaibacterium sp.]
MTIIWTISDQQSIKPISKNRINDFDKLAEEVQLVDLQPLMGFDFFQDIIQKPNTTWNKKLLDGGTYTYNSIDYVYSGLKFVLSYFLYARHIGQSNEFNTFSGMTEKIMTDSRTADLGIIKNRQNSVRKIANTHWEDCAKFIQANISEFPKSLINPLSPNNICCDRRYIRYL